MDVHILDEEGNVVASKYNIPGIDKIRIFELDFDGIEGRYVCLERNFDDTVIHIAEVRVWGY